MAYPTLMRCLWSSTPVIAGIWTSAIKQVVSMRRGEARKSAADEKASTLYPSDLMSLLMDSRKYGSSSTTETNDAFGMGFRQFARTGHVGGAQQCGRVGMRIPQPAQRMPPMQCQWPVNFGLCPEPN